MRIVIDMQGAQSTGSRDRGIGRYTRSLAKAIIRNRGRHEVLLALNGLFPETIETIRAEFEEFIPQENIRVWYAIGPVGNLDAGNIWRRKTAELVREAFLASLNPDIVLVTSLFEGLNDDTVTSIGALSSNIATAVILYDLIPFIHRQPYLENPTVELWYENKLDHLRRGDLFLAISESSRQEGVNYLGLPEDVTVNISTAADAQFNPQIINDDTEANIRRKYGLKNSYIMYTGGIDHRKNIEGLIRAYSCLPKKLRNEHQLAVVCSIQPHDKARLEALAKEYKLKSSELVLTGYVPEDDLLALYALCKVFVFPSFHEGFGLPALEAMSCGRAVIGANSSSVPEVIGLDDALFNPKDDQAIANKLFNVLTDDAFCSMLEKHGLKQAKKFSWKKSAITAINAFESFHEKNKLAKVSIPIRRPKLAFVSPLLPERSGISDYSVELLPELSRHYDIDIVVNQDVVSAPWVNANCPIRNVAWFRQNANHYDRVLYHFGNSPFHMHMFSLLEEIPGIVVLHDFFLSSVVSHMDFLGLSQNGWVKELYRSHGYCAVIENELASDQNNIAWKYPCNLGVLREAQGIIVHSENSEKLSDIWYGLSSEKDHLTVIPLLRGPVIETDRNKARDSLKLNNNDFVICSFGVLGPHKLNHHLLEAWLASGLAKDDNCVLVFVGENHDGEYGQSLHAAIKRSGLAKRIRITGWVDAETYQLYLAAADIGVQLRTLSRGETSAAVLDCMNYGLPTIVNTNGSMADLPDGSVCKIPNKFNVDQLTGSLENLWQDKQYRIKLGNAGREMVLKRHAPRTCADQYFTAIEKFNRNSSTSVKALTQNLAGLEKSSSNMGNFPLLAEAISHTIPPLFTQKQLFLDISTLVQHDARTGIQRVVRSILKHIIINPPSGVRIEPVYATLDHGYRYARVYTQRFLNCAEDILYDELIEYRPGDIFLGLDLLHHVVITHKEFYQKMRRHGVMVQFVVYDLLCILMPDLFNFGENAGELHSRWLEVVTESDGAVCISKSVADELNQWTDEYGQKRLRAFKTTWFHLGADIENSMPSKGLPDDAENVLKIIRERSSFLMVGTFEPRKGHAQTLSAFDLLWEKGVDVNLVIVGKQGWNIENTIEKIKHHPELGTRLFWFDGISDEYLEKIYASTSCLISASVGEGFGLPLIEAAQHKLPIIARDIPVFREVAGEHAYYFESNKPHVLAKTIQDWLKLYRLKKHPSSEKIPWLTWKESAQQLLNAVGIKNTKTKEEI